MKVTLREMYLSYLEYEKELQELQKQEKIKDEEEDEDDKDELDSETREKVFLESFKMSEKFYPHEYYYSSVDKIDKIPFDDWD